MIAVLFIIPGSIVNIILDRFFPKSKKEKSDFEKTIHAIIYSSVIIFINLVIMNKVKNINVSTFTDLQEMLSDITFFIEYIVLTFISSILFVIIKGIYEKIELSIVNIIRKLKKLPTESKFATIWDELFENKDIDLSDTYITIIKDGKIISQGCLKTHSPPNLENRELLLIGTKDFKAFLKNDIRLEDDEKLLDIVDKEYYNLNTGVLIRFYNNTKLINYLNED